MHSHIDGLAVDGGGTHCRAILSLNGTQFEAQAGSANVSSDFDGAIAQINKVAALVAEKAGIASADLSRVPTYLGLAGMISADIASALKGALSFSQVCIEDDRPAALRGALAERDGAIAHCGTGSFLASQIAGQRRIIGGWGAVLGDQASAQWLGRKALSHALDVNDGLIAASALSTSIFARLDTPADIVSFAATASPTQFGDFAKEVTRHANRDDPSARALMQQGADYLAQNLVAIGWRADLPICLTGGLAPHYASYLPSTMRQRLCQPQGTPLTGALKLAEEFAQHLIAD